MTRTPEAAHDEWEDTVSEIREAPAGAWTIEVTSDDAPKRVQLEEGERLEVGSARGVDVRLDDPSISARHCALEVAGGRLIVRDLGSRNGVYGGGGGRVAEARFESAGCFVVARTVFACEPLRGDDGDVASEAPLPGLVGASVPMRRVARDVRRFAAVRAPVLVRGETGTGKELVAAALHAEGPRRDQPFVPLNMGALPGELADAELFGHVRGAFTGAVAARRGAFDAARGGTLFLDEIAELPLPTQAKLLRALENGEVRSLGSDGAKRIDVRVVAATWAPLDRHVEEGVFREDLFHRLAVLTIDVPPLRERKVDIPLLARALLNAQEAEIGERLLHPSALARLVAHAWPGNVRELRNVLLRAAVGAEGATLRGEDVARALSAGRSSQPPPPPGTVRKRDAKTALAAHGGNISKAARELGVARSTVRQWTRKT